MGFGPLPAGSGSQSSMAEKAQGHNATHPDEARKERGERSKEGHSGAVTSINSMSFRDLFSPSRDHLLGGPVTWESRWQFMREHDFALLWV